MFCAPTIRISTPQGSSMQKAFRDPCRRRPAGNIRGMLGWPATHPPRHILTGLLYDIPFICPLLAAVKRCGRMKPQFEIDSIMQRGQCKQMSSIKVHLSQRRGERSDAVSIFDADCQDSTECLSAETCQRRANMLSNKYSLSRMTLLTQSR